VLFFRKILWALLAAPGAAILVALAVANRHSVVLKLDPVRPDNPAILVNLPFYAYIFAALILGMLIGGALVWLGQGKFRRRLRVRTHEAYRWHSEATRLNREKSETVAANRGLPVPIGASKA
jgi:uncharacterized integral membrane protein